MTPMTLTTHESTLPRHPALAALAALAVVTAFIPFFVPPDAASWIASASWTAAGLFAALACVVAVREASVPEQRRRWALLSAACWAWLAGELAWNAYELLGVAPGTPSVADVGWLIFAPLAIAGVHRLSTDPPLVRTLVMLDAVAMVTVACTFGVLVFFDEMVASELSAAGRVTAIAYSGLYAGVLLTLVQSLVRRVSLRTHPELILLLVGLVCCAVGFFSWTPQLLLESYVAGGNVIDVLWTFGMLAMGAAALEASGRMPLPARTERDLARTVVLPAAGLVALAVALPVLALGDHALGQRLAVHVGILLAGTTLLARFFVLTRWHLALVDEVRDLYDHAPCGYHSVDADGLIVRMNDTELRWLGYDHDEIVGKRRLPDLLTAESARRWEAAHQALRRDGFVHDLECEVVRRDGSTLPVALNASAVHDDQGQFVKSRSTLFDVTDRRAARLQLEEVASELRRSNTELEHFAYAASHDLAEPLRTMTSFGQMLSRRYAGQLDEKGERFLGHITDGAERMQALIDSMLAYSRIGRATSEPATIEAGPVVEQVVASLATTFGERRGTVTVGDLPTVCAVSGQLAQVFQNLIANALKFTADRAPEIAISAARDGAAWRFTVADNGIGIEPRHADRIFQMFQRLHARDEYEGMGIGLALCSRIVERHGGRMWVDSEPGEGSRFYFTIPDPPESPR